MSISKIYQWQATALKAEFVKVENSLPTVSENEALIKVAGCGVCHTDLSFWHDGVRTKKDFPLTLGHEISGTVVEGPAHLKGKNVIIPAVLPCGNCELCNKGRSNMCQHQLMPGNDFHGGFASHIVVPHQYLCVVPDAVLSNYKLEELAVIADAISTPYQVIKKSELEKNDLAICIGVGGVGVYGALIANIMGAKVLAIDINDAKLEAAKKNGVDATLNSKGLDLKEIKNKVKEIAKQLGTSKYGWKIFEFSGTAPGQELAFNLITFTSTLSIVGFTMNKLEVRLSNLMAFDAKLIGTWGCKPELYPEVVELIASGKLNIKDFVQTFPMSKINEVFKNTLEHKYDKRSVLVPDY
ncbi:6-hydroxycyclohex-1-ene-1-carbonyl-CoA dehydrogenase [Flavobacteriales bacterium]|nr:6-hydroxycyclohex-1-ene-1-carbonyl-CoA dehydrogenase [Flavobacteriales bacterium]MCL4815315.1 6-hydroxycyclohex-1-ene-1-carbonyl-CoA dehydrogenase [Flavobacteriales bacterium]WKZ74931.1 MAG: 6-hydroxycyclohex-1-ene-1-carbonyl-CoA dehydrogenase [Vicingaceae bacterium]CAG0961257.1 6-hydroxycyclohex-1-ene-1-carbonyl-CoA dehydrogenase [Flavobacteriales bacterium]